MLLSSPWSARSSSRAELLSGNARGRSWARHEHIDFICSKPTQRALNRSGLLGMNVSEFTMKLRIFINVCVYYRIWIINFIIIISSIYRFLKNEKFFIWIKEQKDVMNILKLILTIASTLKFLNYSSLMDEIILTMDFNLKK